MDCIKQKLDEQLTCPICLDRYRSPKALPCLHTFCKECVKQIFDHVKQEVKCPECRKMHSVPSSGIEGFPNNYSVLGFLELQSQIEGN